jgi:hypothetical protein
MQSQGGYGGIHRLKKYYGKISIRCVHMEWSNLVQSVQCVRQWHQEVL